MKTATAPPALARRRYRDFTPSPASRALTLTARARPIRPLAGLPNSSPPNSAATPAAGTALPLGSFLWTTAQSTPDLLDSPHLQSPFLEAVHALTFVRDGNVRRAVDYKNLGSKNSGSDVYQGIANAHQRRCR